MAIGPRPGEAAPSGRHGPWPTCWPPRRAAPAAHSQADAPASQGGTSRKPFSSLRDAYHGTKLHLSVSAPMAAPAARRSVSPASPPGQTLRLVWSGRARPVRRPGRVHIDLHIELLPDPVFTVVHARPVLCTGPDSWEAVYWGPRWKCSTPGWPRVVDRASRHPRGSPAAPGTWGCHSATARGDLYAVVHRGASHRHRRFRACPLPDALAAVSTFQPRAAPATRPHSPQARTQTYLQVEIEWPEATCTITPAPPGRDACGLGTAELDELVEYGALQPLPTPDADANPDPNPATAGNGNTQTSWIFQVNGRQPAPTGCSARLSLPLLKVAGRLRRDFDPDRSRWVAAEYLRRIDMLEHQLSGCMIRNAPATTNWGLKQANWSPTPTWDRSSLTLTTVGGVLPADPADDVGLP